MADTWYWTDDGIAVGLGKLTGKNITDLPPGSGTLRLFQNNPSPAPSKNTVLADLTECTFAGYSGAALNTSTWAAATVTGHVATSTYGATVTFTRSTTGAGQTVYGAYVTDSGNTKLYGVCLFAGGPFTVTSAGDQVSCIPRWTLESKN